MRRFVYGPSSFVGTFLVGLAVVATASYLLSVSPVDRYLLGQECIEARNAAGADEVADEWAVYQALMKEEGLYESHLFWNAFHLSHPLTSGTLSLSRVGFNPDRTEAIVSFSFSCGGLCGHRATWKFSKIDGKWQKTGSSGAEFYS